MIDEDDDLTKHLPLSDLKTEPGSDDIVDSTAMTPYVNLARAVMAHNDPRSAVEEIAALPLEKRYVWRVVSALKWAFADFENLSVVADRRTLSQEDLDTLADLLRLRPLQFCLFLSALYGEDRMEAIIASSVRQVKELREKRRQTVAGEAKLGEE